MATIAILPELSDRQSLVLLLSIMGAIGSGVFAALCWAVKFAVRREIAHLDKLAKERRDLKRKVEWIEVILALHGLVPVPGPPADNE